MQKAGKGKKAIVACKQCEDSTFKKSGRRHLPLKKLITTFQLATM